MNKLIIEKDDLIYNINKIKEHSRINGKNDNGKDVQIIAVVKANAYGLGMKEFVQVLIDNGINFFAVSTIEEAIKFRKLGFTQKLLLLSSTSIKEYIDELIENDVILTIGSRKAAEVAEDVAKEKNRKIKVHIKIDTGFGRYGFMYDKKEEIVETIKKFKNLNVEGTFTHFSNAFYDDKYTKIQFKRFIDCIEVLNMNKIKPGILHVCNSSAFVKFPDMHLNAVRIGSAFSGRLSFNNDMGFKKIAILESYVSEIKELNKGENIGYSNGYKTSKKTKIAIIPCGYVEGFNLKTGKDLFRNVDKIRYIVREIKNFFKKERIFVDINNNKCEVLGRIGTFHVIADVTQKNIKIGDKVMFQINPILVDSEVKREYI